MPVVLTLLQITLQMTEELTHPAPSRMNKHFSLNIGLQTFLPQHVLQPQCSEMRCQHEVNGPSFSP